MSLNIFLFPSLFPPSYSYLIKYLLYLKTLREASSDFPWAAAQHSGEGKPTQMSQLRSTKKENTCTGFNISFLHIWRSLLTDSNNQDTRIQHLQLLSWRTPDTDSWYAANLVPVTSQTAFREWSGKGWEAGGGGKQFGLLAAGIHKAFYVPTHLAEDLPTSEKGTKKMNYGTVRSHRTEVFQALYSLENI